MSCPLQYATKRELPPNISAYPVARHVVKQAVSNTWNRVRQVLSGTMTMQELEEANLQLALWLYDTFTGKNAAFSSESEFNEINLAQYLRESIGGDIALLNPGVDLSDDEAFLFASFAYFVSEIFVVLKASTLVQNGIENNPQIEAFIDLWTLRLTGAPTAGDFKTKE